MPGAYTTMPGAFFPCACHETAFSVSPQGFRELNPLALYTKPSTRLEDAALTELSHQSHSSDDWGVSLQSKERESYTLVGNFAKFVIFVLFWGSSFWVTHGGAHGWLPTMLRNPSWKVLGSYGMSRIEPGCGSHANLNHSSVLKTSALPTVLSICPLISITVNRLDVLQTLWACHILL